MRPGTGGPDMRRRRGRIHAIPSQLMRDVRINTAREGSARTVGWAEQSPHDWVANFGGGQERGYVRGRGPAPADAEPARRL
jgi:hypothetical protein